MVICKNMLMQWMLTGVIMPWEEIEIPYMVIDLRFLEIMHMQMTQKVTNTKGIQATREKETKMKNKDTILHK